MLLGSFASAYILVSSEANHSRLCSGIPITNRSTCTHPVADMLYVIRMSPIPAASVVPGGPTTLIAQVLIRYSVKTSATVDIGSAVKTFEVVNTGNIPCAGQDLCSPDGKWKAASGALSLDAGEGNAFRNPRVSCIAGPCPFTKIDSESLTENNRVFKVSVRDWSDPATFLVEAEVVHPMTGEIIRQFYPAILGRNLILPCRPRQKE